MQNQVLVNQVEFWGETFPPPNIYIASCLRPRGGFACAHLGLTLCTVAVGGAWRTCGCGVRKTSDVGGCCVGVFASGWLAVVGECLWAGGVFSGAWMRASWCGLPVAFVLLFWGGCGSSRFPRGGRIHDFKMSRTWKESAISVNQVLRFWFKRWLVCRRLGKTGWWMGVFVYCFLFVSSVCCSTAASRSQAY